MRVSVIIPAYNCGELLPDAVESCVRQTRAPDEIIIVDDGSTDNTREAARRSARTCPAVRLIEMERNQGVAAARNAGISAASGDLIAFLDADDELAPDALRRAEQVMHRERSDWCACSVLWVWPDRTEAQTQQDLPPDWRTRMMFDGVVILRAPFILRGALLDVGMFDARFTPREDWELWIRLARAGKRITLLADAPLYIHRRRKGSLSADKRGMVQSLARVLEGHLQRAFFEGDASLREAYVEEAWNQARRWLRDGKSLRECLRWAERSIRYAPPKTTLRRAAHMVRFNLRGNAGSAR